MRSSLGVDELVWALVEHRNRLRPLPASNLAVALGCLPLLPSLLGDRSLPAPDQAPALATVWEQALRVFPGHALLSTTGVLLFSLIVVTTFVGFCSTRSRARRTSSRAISAWPFPRSRCFSEPWSRAARGRSGLRPAGIDPSNGQTQVELPDQADVKAMRECLRRQGSTPEFADSPSGAVTLRYDLGNRGAGLVVLFASADGARAALEGIRSLLGTHGGEARPFGRTVVGFTDQPTEPDRRTVAGCL
jgi:hypothetical protein